MIQYAFPFRCRSQSARSPPRSGPGPRLPSFSSCVSSLQSSAVKAGVDRAIVEAALNIAEPDEKVLRLSKVQPEFKTPIWDYLGFLVDEQRVADGQAMMRKYDRVLRAAEQQFGVNRFVIAAVWGVETDYGREAGDSFLPHALATLACSGGRRTDFWRGELNAALKLVNRGDLALNELYGSWAGAFGQTQFIPSTYQRLAVDFDGDGRRDLVNSVADALGSTANYLNRAGWREGGSWMIEVSVPEGYSGPKGSGKKASLSTWGDRGLVRADGKPLSGDAKAGLLHSGGKPRTRLPRLRQFRCDLRLQSGRVLRARHLASGRSARRLSAASHGLADQRSRPVACRAAASAGAAAGERL